VFEGVAVNSKVDHFVPKFCEATADNPRVQLGDAARAQYTSLYQEQLRNIIEGYDVYEGQAPPISFDAKIAPKPLKKRKSQIAKEKAVTASAPIPQISRSVPGMFPRGTDRGTFTNWKANHNIIQGGEGYQHAHSDQGRYDEFMYLDVFPFVALHAFGVEPFKLWVLPQPEKRTYGFLHTFEPLNMVFLRGDFVHAGGVGTTPRGHMEFFPRPEAGWTRTKTWWNQKTSGPDPTFLFQKTSFPFAFPFASTPDPSTGDVVLTYPPELSRRLSVPLTKKQCVKEQIPYVPESRDGSRKRRQACHDIQAHTW
jgi:hypothetical protein